MTAQPDTNVVPIRAAKAAQMLTVDEIAAMLRVDKMTIYRITDRGELRSYRFGRSIRVRQDDFEAYVRSAEVRP